jgi:8-oxo-dGTP pyrophosphatase MutT (NUDIX family)
VDVTPPGAPRRGPVSGAGRGDGRSGAPARAWYIGPVRETVYEGKIVTLEIEDGRWEIVRHADAVAVLAVGADGRVLGVRQRRPAIGAETWELPAGLIDAGESPAQAAARELAEEAQLAGTLRELISLYVSPGFTDERVHLFVASDLRVQAGHALDDGEEVQVEWLDPLAAWQAVASGAMATSGVTLLGLRHLLALRGQAVSPADAHDGAPPTGAARDAR